MSLSKGWYRVDVARMFRNTFDVQNYENFVFLGMLIDLLLEKGAYLRVARQLYERA